MLGLTIWYCPLETYVPLYQTDVTSKFVARVPSTTNNRRIFIRPKCGQLYNGYQEVTPGHDGLHGDLRGIYLVTKSTTGTYANSLRCKYVGASSSEPKVADFSHYFRFWCSDADLGKSGGLTGGDGGLDNNDYVAFNTLFAAHDSKADLGLAGGLLGQDGIWDNNDNIAFVNLFFEDCESVKHTCDPGFVAEPPPEEMLASTPTSSVLTESELQQQFKVLTAIYQATGDVRVLERLNALTVGADR